MKRIFLFSVMILLSFSSMAQTANNTPIKSNDNQEKEIVNLIARIDSLIAINNKLLTRLEINTSLQKRYKLYPTENIYNLLLLDTKTGQIEQVQWSLEFDKEGTTTINSDDLSYGVGPGPGTFELYPTKNMYQFILIDKTDGRKWHVQWGLSDSKRWIRRIY